MRRGGAAVRRTVSVLVLRVLPRPKTNMRGEEMKKAVLKLRKNSAAYAPPARPTAPSSASAPASVRPTYASSKASNVSAPARPMPAPISPNASAPVRPMPAPISPNASMPAKPMGGVSAGAPVAVEDKTEAIVKRMKLLERLKSEGLIGDEEYRAKREEILKNI